ncbi:MAG: SIS domain-containing protein [bacterium]
MNNLEKLFKESSKVEDYAKGYLKYLYDLTCQLDVKAIAALVKELQSAYEHENTIFVIGNGGSAATASHMANDLGLDVLKKAKCKKAFRVLALTDGNAVMTAIANDDGYNNLFVNQLRIHYRPGDKLIAISASGNSPNVVEAVEWVKSRQGKTIGLVGFDGGKLNEICDISILAKTFKGEYGPVEDVHLILDHLIATWLQYKMTGENK